jgi:hypothetical protein
LEIEKKDARAAPVGWQRRVCGRGDVTAMANLQAYIQRLGKEDLHGLIDTL